MRDTTRMTIALVLGLLSAPAVRWCSQAPSGTEPAAEPAPRMNPTNILIESYLAGQQLTVDERAFQLLRLAEVATKLDPTLCRLWSEELFRLAFRLPMDWNRVAHEKNAVATLALVDPIRAFELFGSIDNPVADAHGIISEDVRAHAAHTVFNAYWTRKGTAAFDGIRQQAQHLGDTGAYPYLAIVPVLHDLVRLGDPRAESLFGDALAYYPQNVRVENNDEEFVKFLNAVWQDVSASLRKGALEVAVAQLTTKKNATNDNEIYRARAVNGRQQAEFTSRSEKLLADLLPKIRQIDPDLAARLTEQYPNIGRPDPGAKMTEITVIRSQNSSDADVQAAQSSLLLARQVGQIGQIAANDPNHALDLAASITDPEFHTEALSAACVAMDPSDTKCSADLMDRMRDDISRIKDPAAKLRALVALARASAARRDLKTLRSALGEGFDLGQELFERDAGARPGTLAYQLVGFDELCNLTEAGMRADPDTTLARLATAQNQLLQAYLPLEAAEALAERKATAVSGVPAVSP